MPPKVAKAKQLVKTAASGTKSASTGRNARSPQLRRPNKPLGELYTRLAEKSNVDVSQVRQVYETTVDGYMLERYIVSAVELPRAGIPSTGLNRSLQVTSRCMERLCSQLLQRSFVASCLLVKRWRRKSCAVAGCISQHAGLSRRSKSCVLRS